MADVNVLDLSEVTPGSGDSLILFDRATGVATSTRFETLKGAVKGTLDSQVQALEDNDELMFNTLGAKNLLPITATTKPVSGVTFTVNDNGSVAASGTATADISFLVSYHLTVPKSGKYILSKAPSGAYRNSASDYNYVFYLYDVTSSSAVAYVASTDTEVTLDASHQYNVFIIVKSGIAINKTFEPMLRPASIADDTYVPYAPTNRELAAQVAKSEVLVIDVPSFSSLPQTISNANIEDDMVVVNSVLSNPGTQTGDWVVTTSNGSLTITGSISGATTLKLYLMKSR